MDRREISLKACFENAVGARAVPARSSRNEACVGAATGDRSRADRKAPALLSFFFFALSAVAGIPEPETIFYGKVFNHAIGPDYVITQGAFTWVISRPDGRQVTLAGKLEELKDGEFSYQLRVPHQALSAGLEV